MNPSYFVSVPIRNAEGQVVTTDIVRYDKFVRRLLKAETGKEEAYHILAGIVGEYGELVAAETAGQEKEELGDLCFYTQAALNHYNYAEADLVGTISDPNLSSLVELAKFADVVKREYTYRKTRDTAKVRESLAGLVELKRLCLRSASLSQQEVLQANAEKLSERYKSLTYTDAEAIARADKNGKEE